jgi:MFS superfamily sulfate permease-like transporter
MRARDSYGSGVSPFRPAGGRPVLHRLMPVSEQLPGYGGDTLRRDLVAGLTVAALAATALIPLAGDDPGRYASLAALLALLIGAIFLVARLVPPGLPGLQVPDLRLTDALALLPAALGIFFVSFSDQILTARSFAGRHGQHVRADTELAAMGAANLAAGITQAFPVGASGSRTAVNDQMGGRTQLSA